MKLISLFTKEFKILKDEWFLKSMKDDWEIHIKEIESYGENGDFRSKQWYNALKEKINLIISEIPKNKFIVYSDIDTQFFKKCENYILNELKDKDIMFQAWNYENQEANGGFMAIKCNKNTLNFFKKVKEYNFNNEIFGDQNIINKLLKTTDIKWGLFPKKIYSIGLGDLPKDILLHHACCTPSPNKEKKITSLDMKLKLMQIIRNYVNKTI